MNVSKFDFKLIVSSLTAIIVLSVALSSMGLVSTDVDPTDYPELNVETDRFNYALDYPDSPQGRTEGDLRYESNNLNDVGLPSNSPDPRSDFIYVDRDDSTHNVQEGTQINLLVPTGVDNASNVNQMDVTIGEWRGGNFNSYTVTIGENSDETFAEQETEIYIESGEYRVENGTFVAEVTYDVIEHRHVTDTSIADSLIDGVIRLVLLLGWFLTFLFELGVNAIVMLASVVLYLTSLLTFLVTTYITVATSVPAVWQVFTLIPGVILFMETGKIVLVGVSLLPTT